MNLKLALLTAAALSCSAGAAAYEGVVYKDSNANGVRDKGEAPLRGVKVSDGLNVVETDADGRFSLPGYDLTRFLFITTPSGYKTFNRHYIPVTPDTRSYDFGLIPYNNGASKLGAHSFIHITDTEIFNTTGNEAWADDLRRYAASEHPAFIVHTGDICYANGLKEHINLMNTRNMDLPVFYCIGNHDLVAGKYGEELFEQIYGPTYYSFEVGNTHYIVTPMPGGDHRPSYTTDQVAAWLENDLAHVKPGMGITVFNHDLLTNGNEFIYGGKNKKVNLNAHNLKAWIYGHWHINHKCNQGEGVYTLCTSTLDKGGIDHSTSAYRVVSVDNKGNHSTELRYTYIHNGLVIASPKGLTATSEITVNAYSSVAHTAKVTYTISDGAKAIVKNRPLTRRTDFTWSAAPALPAKYTGKELTLSVKAAFTDGSTEEKSATFTYSPDAVAVKPCCNWDNLAGNAAHSAGVSKARLDSTLTLARVCNVGGNIYMTSPLIHKGHVLTATVDEDMNGTAAIYSIDMSTGRIAWKFPVEASIKNTIAIDSDIVFAQDVLGTLYAVDCVTGTLKWKAQMPVNALPALIEGLAATDGVVYAGTGKAMAAYEAKSGKMLWRNSEWGQGEGTTTTLSVGDGVVVGSAQWSALYGNDAKTGKKLWALSDYGLRHRGASAAIHGGLIYIVSDKSVFVIEARSGRIIFRKELPVGVDATSTPLLTGRHIIFGTSGNGLMALDAQTFEPAWNTVFDKSLVYTAPYTRPDASTVETTPLLAGGIVWVAASDGTVYGVEEKSGRICWSHATGAPIFSSVAASGNTLVATDFGGNVYVFATDAKNQSCENKK